MCTIHWKRKISQRNCTTHIAHNCLQTALHILPIDINVLAMQMQTYFDIYITHVVQQTSAPYFSTTEYKQLVLSSFSSFCHKKDSWSVSRTGILLLLTGTVSNSCKQVFLNPCNLFGTISICVATQFLKLIKLLLLQHRWSGNSGNLN